MPIRAVIVDLMDVLLLDVGPERREWEARTGLAEGALMRAMFRLPLFREAILGHVSEEDLWRDVARTLAMNPEEWHVLAEVFYSAFRLNTDLVALLRTLRPRYKTAILSNTPSDMRVLLTERFHLDQEVDTIIISAEEHMRKPEPAFFQLAADRLGVPLQEMLFIDDDTRFIPAALDLGMKVVQFKDTAQALAEMRGLLGVE
jgi:HAD superfamily hydrolase (TIGR01509 family)